MIYDVLFDIQQNLSVPKSKWNDFGNYYSRSCEDILQAVKPLLAKHKAVLLLPTRIVEFANNRHYVEATAILIVGEERIEVTAMAKECETAKAKMDDSQTTGSAMSYAKKYALNSLFAIDDEKDPDQLPPDNKKNNKKTDKPPTATNEIKCSKCGKVIKNIKKDGKVILASDVAKQCGGMCIDCYRKASKGEG